MAGGRDGERCGDMDSTISGNDSTCAMMQNCDETTTLNQCRLSHPTNLQGLATELVYRTVDAEEPQSNLEASVKREKSKILTLDMQSRSGQFGSLNTESDGRNTLLPMQESGGAWKKC